MLGAVLFGLTLMLLPTPTAVVASQSPPANCHTNWSPDGDHKELIDYVFHDVYLNNCGWIEWRWPTETGSCPNDEDNVYQPTGETRMIGGKEYDVWRKGCGGAYSYRFYPVPAFP